MMVLGVALLSLSVTLWKNGGKNRSSSTSAGASPENSNNAPYDGGATGQDEPQQGRDSFPSTENTDVGGGDGEDKVDGVDDDEGDDFWNDEDDDDDGADGSVQDIYSDPDTLAKLSWPELVGIDADEAVEIILQETRHEVDVEVIPEDSFVTADFRTDRVRVFVTEENLVARKPMIG